MKNAETRRRSGVSARGWAIAVCIALSQFTTGCIVGKQRPAATQPATAIDTEQGKPAYWWDKPPVTHITARKFDALWNACRDAVRARGFTSDRLDYRDGVLTTLPLVSKSAYEFWRSDVIDPADLADSSLSTIHRIVRFDLKKLANGGYQATPKVLIERFSMIQRRITSVDQYRDIFSLTQLDVTRANEEYGEVIPAYYWYPIGRDYALERQLAQDVRERLGRRL